jgi:hypothetical protein
MENKLLEAASHAEKPLARGVLGAAKELIDCSLQDDFNGGNARYIRSFPRYRKLSILETRCPVYPCRSSDIIIPARLVRFVPAEDTLRGSIRSRQPHSLFSAMIRPGLPARSAARHPRASIYRRYVPSGLARLPPLAAEVYLGRWLSAPPI